MQTFYTYRNKYTGEFFGFILLGDTKKNRDEMDFVLNPTNILENACSYAHDLNAKADFEKCFRSQENSSKKDDWEPIEVNIEYSWKRVD